MPRTDYPQLEELSKAFEPYATLWKAAAEWGRSFPEWMDGPFPEMDAEAVAADVDR